MENLIEIIQKLFEDIAAFLGISTDILLIMLLGALLLLLILLIIIGKKSGKRSKDSEGEEPGFLEVGPEPVIVYGRGAKGENTEPDIPKQQSEPLVVPPLKPETEPSLPPIQMGQEVPIPLEPQPEPEPEPTPPTKTPTFTQSQASEITPFELFMSAGSAEETAAAAFKPALTQDPLPAMESDFASEILLLFSKQGFTIEKVVYHGTYGGDFIVSSKGLRAYVQVKDWKKKATPRTVQEARYYSNTHNCHKAILVPAAGYTSAAHREAARRAVSLWDAKTLKKIRNGDLSLEECIAASSF